MNSSNVLVLAVSDRSGDSQVVYLMRIPGERHERFFNHGRAGQDATLREISACGSVLTDEQPNVSLLGADHFLRLRKAQQARTSHAIDKRPCMPSNAWRTWGD